jgi:hypothetical protein
MRDRGIILGGLVLFLGLLTFPVWYNLAAGTTSKGPEPKLPIQEKSCVAPLEYMRTSHMDLLVTWRDAAVRRHDRAFTAYDGRHYTISLTQTCMKCHASKADFCDRCHSFAGVTPVCWDCHIDPKLIPLNYASPPPGEGEGGRCDSAYRGTIVMMCLWVEDPREIIRGKAG